MTVCYADLEERVVSLEEFARRADCSVFEAYDLLSNLYDATDDADRRLIKDWTKGGINPDYIGEDFAAGYHLAEYDKANPPASVPYVKQLDAADRRRMQSYSDYMDNADRSYRGIVDALNKVLHHPEGRCNAGVWQTGGGCLAVGINVPTGPDEEFPYAMLTHAEPLPLERKPISLGIGERPEAFGPEFSAWCREKREQEDHNRWHLGIYRSENSCCGGEDDDGVLYVLPYDFHDDTSDKKVAGVVAALLGAEGIL